MPTAAFPDDKRKIMEMRMLNHKFDIKTDDLGVQLSGH
jgi:hypothetical protein